VTDRSKSRFQYLDWVEDLADLEGNAENDRFRPAGGIGMVSRRVRRAMWNNVTWTFGRHGGRLEWVGTAREPLLSVQDASFVRVVLSADRMVRKSKSVSISRADAVGAYRPSVSTPRTESGLNSDSFRESRS
jgi:hypothetical protein